MAHAMFDINTSNHVEQSTLEFNLRLQEHIELIRANKKIDAIHYAKKYLSPWESTESKRIGHAMGLLAFKSDTSCKPYKVNLVVFLSCLY
jgi:macrophage erythroblast attacher